MALLKAADLEESKNRVMSLSHLQSLMKKDPPAYEVEFDQQWKHFVSQLELFKLKPQKPHGSFGEQVMFLAHVGPSFPGKGDALPGELINALDEHYEVMHGSMREVLVQALMLLRNRNQFPCIRTLPLYFKLFGLSDKVLRKRLFTHIVRDITQMNQKSRSQKANKELRDLAFSRLRDGEIEVARRACALFISLFRRQIWKDGHTINLMSAGLVHRDVKIAAALAHLFLGNKTKGLEEVMDESEDEGKKEKEDLEEVAKEITGSRKSGRKEKRLARAKKAAKRVVRKRKSKEEEGMHTNYTAIDLLNDPHTLAERLLQRVNRPGEPFAFRVLLLHLICRVVNRHLLLVPNLYPFIIKYLNPGQQDVTQILACLVEASHTQVPPDELRPCVLHVMRNFVTEVQVPEVIEVGLNGIREICDRAISVLTEDELADLAGFRKFKHKGVVMACRSVINLYREKDPQLLHRSLRGRQATMAMSKGEHLTEEFGRVEVNETIDGLDLLFKKHLKKAAREALDNEDDDDETPKPTTEAAAKMQSSRELMTDKVLSEEDFKKLRKLRLQRSVEMQLGRKRLAEEMSSSTDSDDSTESEGRKSDGERGMPGRIPDAMSAGELKAKAKRAKTKGERIERIKAGRTDHHAKAKQSRQERKGGKTNKENARKKPLMMSMQSREVRKKKGENAKEKIQKMKKHCKRIKNTKNHQKIARRN